MKGAGESFGVATYMYFQTEPAPKTVVYFVSNLAAQMKNTTNVTAVDALAALAAGFMELQVFSLTPLLTPNITFGTYVDSNGKQRVSFSRLWLFRMSFKYPRSSQMIEYFSQSPLNFIPTG